jgi:hypothetical protein
MSNDNKKLCPFYNDCTGCEDCWYNPREFKQEDFKKYHCPYKETKKDVNTHKKLEVIDHDKM